MLRNILLSALAMMLCTCAFGSVERVTIKDGAFFTEKTNKRFVPVGFNYIKLNGHPANEKVEWHCTFAPDEWSRQDADDALKEMSKRGFNTVRVFIDSVEKRGVVESGEADAFSKAYMDNLISFIGLAQKRKIRVVIVFAGTPSAPVVMPDEIVPLNPDIGWLSFPHMEKNSLERKKAYIRAFAAYLKNNAKKCYNSILALELENEDTFVFGDKPLDGKTESFTALDGKTYDLTSSEGVQNLLDACSVYYANMMADVVHSVDPDMLVSASVFTYNAVGKSGPNVFLEEVVPLKDIDARYPMRPLALLDSRLSYIDIHFYPPNAEWLARDFKAVELEAIRKKAKERGKPVIVGEIGATRGWGLQTREDVDRWFENSFMALVRESGFQGYLWWTWDAVKQDNSMWFTAKDSGVGDMAGIIETYFKEAEKTILESK